MEDNTRVLACRIDVDLQQQMKQRIAQQGMTVKEYITGLIKDDLEIQAIATTKAVVDLEKEKKMEEQQNKEIGEQPIEEKIKEDKKEEVKEQPVKNKNEKQKEQPFKEKETKEKQDDKSKKEEAKKQSNALDKNVALNKRKAKKNQKEEEEEFE